jgi:hypothetical protein
VVPIKHATANDSDEMGVRVSNGWREDEGQHQQENELFHK